jgi:hypothetical protein
MSKYKPRRELTEAQRKARAASDKKYYEKNAKRIIERQAQYAINNKGKVPSLTPEKQSEYAKRCYLIRKVDPERQTQHLKTKRAWEKKDRMKNGTKKRGYSRSWALNLKIEVMNAYGGICACCGESEIIFLTIDHINNDGAEKRRNGEPMGNTLYAKLKRLGFPKSEYQVLCMNCNFAKGLYGSCPHQIKKCLDIDTTQHVSSPAAEV